MKNITKILVLILGLSLVGAYAYASITPVNQGGTGVNTATGLIQGNGTSPFTGISLPGTITTYLNGNGAFSTPSGTASPSPIILATITGINAKSTGATVLYTVPSGKTAVITAIYIRVTAATAITNGPSVDVGVTAADIYPNTGLNTLTTVGKVFAFSSIGIFSSSASTNIINLNINSIATGTSETIQCDIIGYIE